MKKKSMTAFIAMITKLMFPNLESYGIYFVQPL